MTVNFKDEIKKDIAESGFNVHDHLKNLDVPALRTICDNERTNFVLGLINVTGDMNCGSLIRSACVLGAQKVIVWGRKKFDRRGLVGSQNYIDIEFVPCLNDDLSLDNDIVINKLINENLQPILIEQNGFSLGKFHWFDIIQNNLMPCFIVGNENRGIPSELLQQVVDNINSTKIVSIPQKGVIRSFNVSCAGSIVMFDYLRATDQL